MDFLPSGQNAIDTPSLIEQFMNFMKLNDTNVSPDTLKAYYSAVKRFYEYCVQNNIDPLMISEDQFKEYRNYLISVQHLKSDSVQMYFSAIKRFYDMLVYNNVIEKNNSKFVQIKTITDDTEKIKFLTLEQVNKLFKVIKNKNKDIEMRDRLMVAFMVLEGMRTIEVSRLQMKDMVTTHIDNSEYIGFTVQAKRHRRTVYLTTVVTELFLKYLEQRNIGAEEYIFTNSLTNTPLNRRSIRRIVDGYLTKAHLKQKGLSAHALRHTAATMAYSLTGDITRVQHFLGHTSPAITSVYVHLLDKQKLNPLEELEVDISDMEDSNGE